MTSAPVPAKRLMIVPLIVSTALFMQNLDSTILTTALPTIATDFGSNPLHLKLALTSYLLALAVFIPTSGWMADRFGARRVFQAAMGVFALGSIGCALSFDLTSMVAARVLQGLGGAMMMPVGRLVVLRSVPRSELVAAFALLSMPALIGPIMGPPLGGFLTTFLSWHWIFWINIPIALLGIALAGRFIPMLRQDGPAPFDAVGFVLIGPGLALLLTGTMLVGVDVLPGTTLATFAAVGAVLIALYVLHARGRAGAPIDLRLLRITSFRAGIVGGLFFRIGVGASPFLLPLLLQSGFGFSAFEAGSLTLATGVGALTMKFLAPRILNRFGFRRVLAVNAVLAALLLAAPGLFSATMSGGLILAVLLAGGFSRSLQFTSVNALLYCDVQQDAMSRATTFGSVMQELAGAVGVTIAALTLELTQRALGGAELAASHFPVAFAVVGVIAAIAAVFFQRMPADTGAALVTRKAPGDR
ncbi:MAG: MFS transporter [Alphaproteobacteria bacterium]|nr:MFS transporter [Alphaproteobacteria bacterium]